MVLGKNKKKKVDAAAAGTSGPSPSGRETTNALKPEPKITKKSPTKNSANAKESKGPQSPQPKLKNKNNDSINKEKNAANTNQLKPKNANNDSRNKEKNAANRSESLKTSRKGHRGLSNKNDIGGMVFMCNSKTKPDCFRYMVMGLPESKKQIVVSAKPGVKLFLFDFDTRLLHGIYKATSAGGMNIEPAAFDGSYPAQVRFKVIKHCLPISEGAFKTIVNSGTDKFNFEIELTFSQAQRLTDAFQPSPHYPPNMNLLLQAPQPVAMQPIAYPLVPQPIIPVTEAPRYAFHPDVLARGPFVPEESRRQKETAPIQRETVPRDPLTLSEKEYRTYGLKRGPPMPDPAPQPSSDSSRNDPYYTNALPMSRAPYLIEPDYQTDHSRRIMEDIDYKQRPPSENLATRPASYLGHSYGAPRSGVEYGRREAEAVRLHSTYAANTLSEYNRSQQQLGGDFAASTLSEYNRSQQQLGGSGDFGSLPVSSRYSFAGPSFQY